MPIWPFRSRPSGQNTEVVASVMLGSGIAGNPEYPPDNWDNFAREGYGRNEVVYACIREIYTSAAEGRLRLEKGAARDKGEEIERGDLAERLRNPNENLEQFEFLELLNMYLDIAGNAYVLKERGQAGQVVAWRLMRPDRITVVPGPRGPFGYLHTINGMDWPIAAEDVSHIRLPNPFDDYYGLSPLHVLAKMVNVDASITDFNKMFFQNAAVPTGIINLKRRIKNEEEANAARISFMNKFSGRTNWFKMPVLDEDASYQQIASNLKDMEFTSLRDIPESRICAVFNVPPVIAGVKAGLDASTYSNYETARLVLWQENLLPRNKLIRAGLRRLCAEYPEIQGGAVLDWDYSDVKALQEGEDERSARIVAQWTAGLITRDEARDALGYDPAPEQGVVFAVGRGVTFIGPDAEEPEPVVLPPQLAPGGASDGQQPPEDEDDGSDGNGRGKGTDGRLSARNGHIKVLV